MAIIHISSGDADPNEPRADRSFRRLMFTTARFFAVIIVFPILLGAVVLGLLVNSSRGHAYLINLVQRHAGDSLGVPVHLQNFDLHLARLSVDLYGLTIEGAGLHPNLPLLQVQHVEAGVRIVSVFGREWYFDGIHIDNPVAHIFVGKDGVSNLPTFKSSNSSKTSVFDLGIRHVVLANGMVFYNNQLSQLALNLRDVQFNSTFDSHLKKYSGTVAYPNGTLNYAGNQTPTHALDLTFDATPSAFRLLPAKIQSGKTNLVLNATINNYSSPIVHAQYSATVDGEQLATSLHNPTVPSGLMSVSGNAQFQSTAGRTALQSLIMNGDVISRRLVTKAPSFRAEVCNIAAHYSLANGDATLRDFRASLLGGEVTAQGTIKNIGGDSHAKFEGAVHGISLARARGMMWAAASGNAIEIAGTLNATATATWEKSLDNLISHTDASIHAGAVKDRHAKLAAPQVSFQSPIPDAPSSANSVPIEGILHATYFGATQRLALEHSYFHTSQTNLNLNGTVSRNSSLAVQIQANDLHEVESIVDFFRTPSVGQSLKPLGLSGKGSFTGVVRGSTTAPHLTGELTAQNLQVQGSSWKRVRTTIDASPSNLSLKHAELESAAQGCASFNASAELHQWSFSKSSPLQLQLSASQLDISELAKIVGRQIPATGNLAADIGMHGSVLNPEGTGTLTLSDASAYGERISLAKVTFNGSGEQVRANLSVSAPAGAMEAKVTSSINKKTYSAEVTSSGIHLDRLQNLKTSNMNPTGVVSISAKGQGTFDNPQFDAVIQIPSLVVQQQTISGIRLLANLANHEATAQLTSSAVNTLIKASAKVGLTGDYPADAKLDTQNIPLGPLFAVYAPDQAANITGQTELHATLHGPLKDRRQLEGRVTIPLLKIAYSNTVQLAATSPIHIDYKNETINVQRSSIQGTDTDLQFQGSIPTAGNAPMSLLLLGSIDLHLAQLFNPDLRTSGHLRLKVNSYGAARGAAVAGTVEIVDAALATPDLPVGLQHCNGTLELTQDRINISQLKGNLGGGSLTAQGGVALRPSIQYDLGVAAHDIRMLYPQGMRESINANIRLTGSPQAALLGGNINLADLSFTPAFDLGEFINQFTGGIETPPSQGITQNIALNLAVHSSNQVSLVSRTLSVGGSANLQVRGTVADPVILGRANLTGGDIILNGNRFILTGGTIQFVNPSVTQPVANLSLTTSIQQYNINLRFEGPVDQLRTQYSSDPALPSADIIHLLAFGQTTEASAANATPANQAAETLVANQVSSQVTSRISKVAGISQLSINPVLAGGNSQGPAGANITVQQRVTGNLFVTFSTNVQTTQGQTIQGQYQVTPRVAVSATRDPNGGFAIDTLIKKTW